MNSHNNVSVSRRGFLKTASLSALSSIVLLGLSQRVSADVPDVQQIENISQDSMGKIRVQIRHANPNPQHYIDIVEADVDGEIKQFNLDPQNTDPFTVELDLGETQGTPNVKARSHCKIHGWGAWSGQIQIPEFPTAIIAFLGALAGSIFILKKLQKS